MIVITKNAIGRKLRREGVIGRKLRREGVNGRKLRREGVNCRKMRREGVNVTPPGGASSYSYSSILMHVFRVPPNGGSGRGPPPPPTGICLPPGTDTPPLP